MHLHDGRNPNHYQRTHYIDAFNKLALLFQLLTRDSSVPAICRRIGSIIYRSIQHIVFVQIFDSLRKEFQSFHSCHGPIVHVLDRGKRLRRTGGSEPPRWCLPWESGRCFAKHAIPKPLTKGFIKECITVNGDHQ